MLPLVEMHLANGTGLKLILHRDSSGSRLSFVFSNVESRNLGMTVDPDRDVPTLRPNGVVRG